MARVTVEDCLQYVENRFELVRLAAVRARQLDEGYARKLDETGEKNTLFALREIAAGKIDRSILKTEEISSEEGEAVDFQEGMRHLAEDEKKRRKEEEDTKAAMEANPPEDKSDADASEKEAEKAVEKEDKEKEDSTDTASSEDSGKTES